MEDRLPHDRNLLKQFDLEGGGPCTATCPEPVEGVVLGDGGGEAAIRNHRHRLPHHLHEAYAAVLTSPFMYQDHRLPVRLLQEFSFPECRLDQLHHHLPFFASSPPPLPISWPPL